MSAKIVGRCIDCDTEVTFEPKAFLPWHDETGNGYCPVKPERTQKSGQGFHRLPRDLAEAIFDEYLAETGERSNHDIRRG